jgi:TonB-dependent receptor
VHKVFDYYYANPSQFTVDPVDEGQNEVEDDYDTKESIYAVYGMAEVQLSDKLTAITGLRYEKTDASIESFEMRLDDDDNIIGIFPSEADFSYDNFLPNLQFRYALSERQVLRFAVTGTIGRPRYEDTASQSILEYAEVVDPDDPAFPYTGVVDPVGNPDLQPYESVNFDLSYERYLRQGGLVAVSLFYKAIDNPIYNYREVRDNYVYNGLGFEQLELRSVRNADSGYVSGVEFNLQLPFETFTSGFIGRFGIDVNATFIKSGAKLNPDPDPNNQRDLNIPFFRQPDRIANLGFYYQGPRLTARVAYNYQSNSIREVSGGPGFDIYQGGRDQVDLQVSYKISENYQLYANWQNVTDEPTIQTFGDDTNRIRRGLLYGSNVRAGIRFNF